MAICQNRIDPGPQRIDPHVHVVLSLFTAKTGTLWSSQRIDPLVQRIFSLFTVKTGSIRSSLRIDPLFPRKLEFDSVKIESIRPLSGSIRTRIFAQFLLQNCHSSKKKTIKGKLQGLKKGLNFWGFFDSSSLVL